jgi:polyvinyl alcohol dehydrogenase (cytochrome)
MNGPLKSRLLLCVLCALFFVCAVLSPALFGQAAAAAGSRAQRAASLQEEKVGKTAAAAQPQQEATNKAGESLYKQRCAACHEGGVPRVPNRAALQQMSPENIRFALKSGSMVVQGLGLSSSEIADIAEFLTGKQPAKEEMPATAFCAAGAAAFADPLAKPHWSGWGANLEQHRFQPAEMAQLSADQVPKLKLKWAFGFPGVTRAQGQATVAGGRVFVASLDRPVYSLNAETGCIYWALEADSPLRTAVSIGPNGSGWTAYFGDQHANAYAVDAASGKLLWKTHVEEFPGAVITGAPTLAAGRLYVPTSSLEEVFAGNPRYECCRFRGSVSALNAATAKVLWKSYTVTEEPKPVRKSKGSAALGTVRRKPVVSADRGSCAPHGLCNHRRQLF